MKPDYDNEPFSEDQNQEMKAALSRISGKTRKNVWSEISIRYKSKLAALVLLLALFVAVDFWLRFGNAPIPALYLATFQKLALGATLLICIVLVASLFDILVIERVESHASRFNLKRVAKLVAALAMLLTFLSLVFATWYTAAVSLGLMSLVLGFALQTPITSFIGWIYILIRVPYRVGDRIEIGDAAGDVIDVGYFDTSLWEVGGQYLSTDHPSGRIIKFPNSNVLSSAVFNYSWPLFPYIWNEVKLNIAYGSDLELVARIMEEVATDELGETMMRNVVTFRDILADTPVDEVDVQERPVVLFRISENTWVEAIVRYLVHPKLAGPVKTKLIRTMLSRLNAESDRVMFPKGDSR